MARAAAHFFLIGALLLVVRAAASGVAPERAVPLLVSVSRGATTDEVEAAVERSILVAEATRRGWTSTDPVIRRRLVRNLRFVRGRTDEDAPPDDAEEEALLGEALRLGMHHTDPVVRQRLAQRLDHAAYQAARRVPVSDDDVRQWMEEHPELVERPARLRSSQVFLSRQRRGAALEADARRLGARLRGAAAQPPAEAALLGDPLPFAPSSGFVTAEALGRRFGPTLADAAATAPVGQWVGPLRTTYGLHFLWVHEVRAAEMPSIEQAREQATSRIVGERRAQARLELLEEMRRRYVVDVVRLGGRR